MTDAQLLDFFLMEKPEAFDSSIRGDHLPFEEARRKVEERLGVEVKVVKWIPPPPLEPNPPYAVFYSKLAKIEIIDNIWALGAVPRSANAMFHSLCHETSHVLDLGGRIHNDLPRDEIIAEISAWKYMRWDEPMVDRVSYNYLMRVNRISPREIREWWWRALDVSSRLKEVLK